ncbi:MAG TPA: tetratricopeptide repeat protein [Candidatus Eremiobacteraceae bacterium]|nr:tetratricopeptide repeat protein [Candidatus Eremiobacteraceae bacterium]
MPEHISRKELKQDKVRETFEHGAEAVLSHTRLASIALLVLILVAAGYLGWRFYNEHQTAQAQAALDEAMKIFNAPIATAGQAPLPGEMTYPSVEKRDAEAQPKLAAVAAKYPHTNPGKLARYYSALCLMDLEHLNQASEELKKLDAGSDKELAALGKYQTALIAERSGRKDEAIKILQGLTTAGSVLVPKPMVQLELAGIYSQTDPKKATALYEQLKKDYPNTPVADEADRGLELLGPNS